MVVQLQNVTISFPESMARSEAEHYAREEILHWQNKNKKLGRVEMEMEGDDVVIKAFEKSPIRRIRRITGYLSEIVNFNDAKVEELQDRFKHS